jgi:MFS family permease
MTRSRRGFVGLMAAEVISFVGSRMTFVALPWLVLVTTGSATKTGIVAFAETLPYALVCAAGGPLIDRIGPRRTAIWSDVVSALVVAAIPLLYRSGELPLGALICLVAIAGAVRALGDTAKRVIFPAVVRTADVDLTRATSVHDGLSRLALLIGAPLAGVLVAATDAPTVLFFDAASFALAAILIKTSVPNARREAEADEAGPSYLRQLRDGASYVRTDRLVLGVLAMVFVTNLIDQAYGAVLVPVWAKEFFGSPVGLGLTSAAFAAGAVGGNIVYTVLAPRLPRYWPYTIGFLIGGAPRFVALAFDSPLWTVLSVAFAAGVGLSVVNPILGAVLYTRIPERLHARVFGLTAALSWAGIPLGAILGGWLADTAGLRVTLLISAAGYLGATLMPLFGAAWREMDDKPAASPAPKPRTEYGESGDAGGRGTQDGRSEPDRDRTGLLEGGQFLGGDAALGADDEHDVARIR